MAELALAEKRKVMHKQQLTLNVMRLEVRELELEEELEQLRKNIVEQKKTLQEAE